MTGIGPRVRTALQINMHPFDVRHVVETLPHQLRVFGDQVDRVWLTLDTRVARTGRYHSGRYAEARIEMLETLNAVAATNPKVSVDEVDYVPETRRQIGETFFSQTPDWPDRAFDGGPFLVYFHGLMRAHADYVLHMDSDMLFGGGSGHWVADAIAAFADHPDALFVCPFSGPPLDGGHLRPELHTAFPSQKGLKVPERLDGDIPGYSFDTVSTRIFMIDMKRFATRVVSLDLVRPDAKRRLRSLALDESPASMPAEEVLSANLARHGLKRIDWLGSAPGLYSLHPPYRSPEFYAGLPGLIARVEAGDIPDGQRGDYDVNSSMMDWTSALKAKRKSVRIRKALSQLAGVQVDRLQKLFRYRLSSGGWLLDTPGMRELQLTNVKAGLGRVFAEITELAKSCRFTDCQHGDEPDCAVRGAIAAGEMDPERLERWRKLVAEDAENAESLSMARQRPAKRSTARPPRIREDLEEE